MASRRARTLAFALFGLLATLALAAGVAWAKRTALAEWLALRELSARGVPAQLRIVRLDLRGAEIAGVKLGAQAAPDFAAERIALAWSYAGLRARRLDRVEVRGVRLRAHLDEAGVHLGALDALLAGDASASSATLALPFAEAVLADASAVIDSPQGALRLRAEGNAMPEGDLVRATFSLHGESPQGALDFGGGGTLGLASQEIAAAGALRGVTPWGSAEGQVRVLGTFAVPQIEFAGSALPDAAALSVRTAAPIAVQGTATRDAAGAISADVTLTATGVEGIDVGSAANVEVTARLRGESAEAEIALREIELPDLARFPSASLRVKHAGGVVTAQIEMPRGLAPELARFEQIAIDARYAEERLEASVTVAKLTELSKPALIAPLRVKAQLSGPLERLALVGEARTPGDGLVFDLTGALEPAAARLELKIVLAETDLAPKTRQPQRVFPWLDGVIERAKGNVGGEALASYENGVLAASAVIAFNGTDLETEYGAVRGLTGVISAIGPEPLLTPPGQTLWMKTFDGPLPLANGSVRFELLRDGVLAVELAAFSLAGGKLSLTGNFPIDVEERDLVLRAEGISVAELLAALDLDGLAGTGVLAGVIPVEQRGARMFVRNGELRATETGVIRFTSGESGAALAKKQPTVAPVLGALADLHYEELTLTLNGDASDRMDVKMHIRGRNPNYQKGRPVVLNVNVDAPIGSLLKAGMVAASVPEEIEGQVKRYFGGEKE